MPSLLRTETASALAARSVEMMEVGALRRMARARGREPSSSVILAASGSEARDCNCDIDCDCEAEAETGSVAGAVESSAVGPGWLLELAVEHTVHRAASKGDGKRSIMPASTTAQ